MKKTVWILSLAVCLLTGCAAPKREMGTSGGEVKKEYEEAKEHEKTKEHEEVKDYEETKERGIPIRIYHGDSSAENLFVSTELTEEVTPEILLWNLSAYQALPSSVKAEGFREEKNEEERILHLDLSEDFSEFISSMGTAGETMVMGSLVNTFLDAYGADAIVVTAAGKTVETGHTVYDFPIQMYPYIEASYSVEEELLSEKGAEFFYPQIQDFADKETEEEWNRRMKGKAEEIVSRMEEGEQLQGGFQVKTMNDEILSILVSGSLTAPGQTEPFRFQYTFNIDMKTGDGIRLAHYRDVKKIAADMMEGKYNTADGRLAGEFQERLEILYGDAEQLSDVLRGFDFGDGQEHPAGYSWYEEGKTWISMAVPHALGDYIEIALD